MELSGIEITSPFKVFTPKPLDTREGVFVDIAIALSSIDINRRYKGMVINIAETENDPITQYWFQSGIADEDLVLRTFTSGIDDVLALAQNLTTNRSINTSTFDFDIITDSNNSLLIQDTSLHLTFDDIVIDTTNGITLGTDSGVDRIISAASSGAIANIILSPKGSGLVKAPAGYEALIGSEGDAFVTKQWIDDNIADDGVPGLQTVLDQNSVATITKDFTLSVTDNAIRVTSSAAPNTSYIDIIGTTIKFRNDALGVDLVGGKLTYSLAPTLNADQDIVNKIYVDNQVSSHGIDDVLFADDNLTANREISLNNFSLDIENSGTSVLLINSTASLFLATTLNLNTQQVNNTINIGDSSYSAINLLFTSLTLPLSAPIGEERLLKVNDQGVLGLSTSGGGGGGVADYSSFTANNTSGNESVSGAILNVTPQNGLIIVYLNGTPLPISNDKNGIAYISNDGGTTVVPTSSASQNDAIIFNGVNAGYELTDSDTLHVIVV